MFVGFVMWERSVEMVSSVSTMLLSRDRQACMLESSMGRMLTRGRRPDRNRGSSPLSMRAIIQSIVGVAMSFSEVEK